jgi:hypothetical protein
MPKYLYRLEMFRNVSAPEYGSGAYRRDYMKLEFPFGKGAKYPTGAKAEQAAEEAARRYADQASGMTLFRLTTAGNGLGRVLKDERTSRFAAGWETNVEA